MEVSSAADDVRYYERVVHSPVSLGRHCDSEQAALVASSMICS